MVEISDVDVSTNDKRLNLPPYPEALLQITPEAQEVMKYKGNPDDIPHRIKHKLFLIWIIWAQHRNDERLIKIVNSDMDKESEQYYLANSIVQMLDGLGRALSLTDITSEIFQAEPIEKKESNDADEVGLIKDSELL
jgi:hypothetical protein